MLKDLQVNCKFANVGFHNNLFQLPSQFMQIPCLKMILPQSNTQPSSTPSLNDFSSALPILPMDWHLQNLVFPAHPGWAKIFRNMKSCSFLSKEFGNIEKIQCLFWRLNINNIYIFFNFTWKPTDCSCQSWLSDTVSI